MSAVLAEYQALENLLLAAFGGELAEAKFAELALAVHGFQRRWNRPYQKYAECSEPPRTWQAIPAVPQAAFKRATLTCVPWENIGRTFLTSGTTGEVRGAHHFLNTRLYEAALLGGWNRLGLPAATLLILAPSPDDAPNSSLSHMLGTLARERGTADSAFFVGSDGRLAAVRFAEALAAVGAVEKPVGLLGTALGFLNFFEQAGDVHFPLPKDSFALETGGFKGSGREVPKAELYAHFARVFGLEPERVLNEYGMCELSSQFYTRGVGGVHTGPPWVRALVIDPETGREAEVGQAGVLRIFDLANLNSVLAVETQDLAIRREEGFALIGRDPAALPRGCSRAADELMRR
jgi:hypothetical protein